MSICGAADTGKSTIAQKIYEELSSLNIKSACICTDSFMIERIDRIKEGISGYNLDSINDKVLLTFVENIIRRKTVKYFPYDNRLGKNVSGHKIIIEPEVLIIEGIHSFNEIIRSRIDLKVFIDAEYTVLQKLRYNANINKRGFSEKEAYKRIDKEMEEYYHYISPNKKYSDRIITMDEKYNYQLCL